jgi:hypothetical protein
MNKNSLELNKGMQFFCILFMLIAVCCAGRVCADGDTVIGQYAVLEGIKLSTQAGKTASEKNVTWYFVFKDKPSSYFYEFDKKNKQLVFEFSDAQATMDSIHSLQDAPVSGFEVIQKKVDANREVKGLTPEWHGLVTVTFRLNKIPKISVKDDNNIVSLNYLWTSDTALEKNYESLVPAKKKYVLWGTIGLGAVGITAGVIAASSKSGKNNDNQLSTGDLPSRQ